MQLMVAEMKRFNPGFRKAKELLDQRVIGDIFLARYHNSYFEPHTRERLVDLMSPSAAVR